MITVTTIKKALPGLTTKELQQVERVLINLYRQRKSGIIFDDSYGVGIEEDQTASTDETITSLNKSGLRKHAKR